MLIRLSYYHFKFIVLLLGVFSEVRGERKVFLSVFYFYVFLAIMELFIVLSLIYFILCIIIILFI